jgi:hypothetical protein
MSTIKRKIKCFIVVIVILISCLNIKVIVDKNDNAKFSLSTIIGLALADGEDPPKGELLFCWTCVPAPGQTGVKWLCIEVDWWTSSCYYIPCGYGICG